MPAKRSRTLEWRRCLGQIRDRGGAIEIAVASDAESGSRDLVWRVRVADLTDTEILIEQPTALGQVVNLEPGVTLRAVIAVGQNRWTFMTRNIGLTSKPIATVGGGRTIHGLRLRVPDAVERCQRRSHMRMSAAGLNLPNVEVWPLLDPSTVVLAERAIELRMEDAAIGGTLAKIKPSDDEIMPDVGPKFTATLMNIGGGGMGLLIEPDDAQVLGHHNILWLRLDLPEIDVPICAMGKVVHSHMESTQQTYAGVAFDFSFNPRHQRVVVGQICRYIDQQQRRQLRRSA